MLQWSHNAPAITRNTSQVSQERPGPVARTGGHTTDSLTIAMIKQPKTGLYTFDISSQVLVKTQLQIYQDLEDN